MRLESWLDRSSGSSFASEDSRNEVHECPTACSNYKKRMRTTPSRLISWFPYLHFGNMASCACIFSGNINIYMVLVEKYEI